MPHFTISADILLNEVINTDYRVKNSILAEKIEELYSEDRNKIYDVIDAMTAHSKKITK